jgi:hypothetical protein
VDWNSLPIYDTHFNYEDYAEVIFFHVIKKLTEITRHVMCLMKFQREVSQLGLEEISFVDFPRVDSFLSRFSEQNFDVGFVMLKEKLIFSGQGIINTFWKKKYEE